MAFHESFSRTRSVSCKETSEQQMDDALVQAVNDAIVSQAFKSAVEDCRFCVTVANPQGEDCPLIAVSKEFETMTGYTRNEILGVNCRFLNQGVDMNPQDLAHLREASASGAPFTAILPNRKKSGELFLNLLDVRGLTVARDKTTGEELWYLIGIQADVSELGEEQVPEDHFIELQMLSDFIRDKIIKELSDYALATQETRQGSCFELLPRPEWRRGAPLGSRKDSKRPKGESQPQADVAKRRISVGLGLSLFAVGAGLTIFLMRRRARG
ncbi:unnamed protein product [Effrenium voratum]|uniref:PAS domain-containing protein n=1 Tax=Effrenium voratum TaxID=2562239 RepID=A0AA36NBU9_9DINO|nr:unnamed protein product [Effrenium voratum]CAJ1447975.1 unnamed protein product [Effrenium voratum]